MKAWLAVFLVGCGTRVYEVRVVAHDTVEYEPLYCCSAQPSMVPVCGMLKEVADTWLELGDEDDQESRCWPDLSGN